MMPFNIKNTALIVGGAILGGSITAGIAFSISAAHSTTEAPATEQHRQVLFWYDPMYPNTRFDKPGKSPFMDMDLVAKYADEEEGKPLPLAFASTRPRHKTSA